MEFKHVSVLLNECIEGLAVKPDGIYVDGTLGGAGHAFHVCEKLSEKGQFIGIDQDEVEASPVVPQIMIASVCPAICCSITSFNLS